MPFRKRKKEAEKQQRLETRFTNEQRVEVAIADTGKIAEPGEKLMKLEEILADINDVIRHQQILVTNKGYDAASNAVGGSAFSAVGILVGGVVTTVLVPPAAPIALSVAATSIPAMVAAIPIASRREKSVKNKFNAEAKDHMQTMDDFKQLVTSMREELVAYITEHKSEILLSPFYEQVSKLPDLSKELEGLAAQELAKYKEMAATANDAPAKTPKLTNKPKIVLSRPPQA